MATVREADGGVASDEAQPLDPSRAGYVELEKDEGGREMYYQVRVFREEGRWVVLAEWGFRRSLGVVHRRLSVGDDPVPTLRRLFPRLRRKGYRITYFEEQDNGVRPSDGAVATGTPSISDRTRETP